MFPSFVNLFEFPIALNKIYLSLIGSLKIIKSYKFIIKSILFLYISAFNI